jgi:hypothetical protein
MALQVYFGGVFTVITFENPELPEALNASTRYRYHVFLVSPVFGKLVTFAPTEAICAKFVQLFPVQRSIENPVSLFELSVHDRLICVAETAGPARLLGAFGTG